MVGFAVGQVAGVVHPDVVSPVDNIPDWVACWPHGVCPHETNQDQTSQDFQLQVVARRSVDIQPDRPVWKDLLCKHEPLVLVTMTED